ncbi:HAD family hydrolase [Aurantiacibacter luteus]|uniref:Haloacid dehalogenase n=1 Tax=Aurantiacibacter luteus TaxID=1581420 RepID=A0A0G9N1K2_9SPHN|nr:HAD family hydrolase [Aurantiacibacter luteus]KLE35423.1 hypothetical protein AAW00_03030 [Aurantiacibacter luteus]
MDQPLAPDLVVYDLDETLTRRATFTPFLLHAARTVAPWRLPFLPIWVMAMIGHKVGLWQRTALKTFGMRLMAGRRGPAELAQVAESFAVSRGFLPRAQRAVAEDLAAGRRVIVATAAFAFYARPIAMRLGIHEVVGTHWDGEGIPGGNCYGPVKLARVQAWLADEGLAREGLRVRVVSDSRADAPLLDWADEGWFVNPSARRVAEIERRGWRVVDFRR